MSLRVIGGEARGRRLEQPPSQTTRPLTDRAREALFNILAPVVPDARVADLFAGSGAVGIEALSRGATHATFVERDRGVAEVVEANLRTVGFAGRADVRRTDALGWPATVAEPYDLVFTGPPQWQDLWAGSLRALDVAAEHVLTSDGVLVSQCDPSEDRSDVALGLEHLERTDQRRYGKVLLTFHRRRSVVGDPERR